MKLMATVWLMAAFLGFSIPVAAGDRNDDVRLPDIVTSVSERPLQSERVFFFNRSGDEQSTIELKDMLIDRGAWHVNAFLPDFIGCEIPAELDVAEILRGRNFTYLPERSLAGSSASAVPPGLDRIRKSYELAARLWSSPSTAAPGAAADGHAGFDDIVLEVPPGELTLPPDMIDTYGLEDDLRQTNQNSEFLVGNILVISIYPESEGGTEDWSDKELADATMGVYTAMINFQEQYGFVPMNFTFKIFRRAATGFEPISYEMETDYLWINDVMQGLGYTPDTRAISTVHAFNEDWRRHFAGRIDWVYTAFIANSQNIANHRFDNGAAAYTAYANLGGPYLVMPFPAGENPYYIDETLVFSQIYQHETCHIFWALDEYPEARNVGCNSSSGYLNIRNLNKVTGFDPVMGQPRGCSEGPPVNCIMWDPKQDQGRPFCQYTRGQMGITDRNNNSVPDVFDSTPEIIFENSDIETVLTSDVTIRADIISRPVPNNNPFFADSPNKREYAAPLKDAVLMVDGTGNLYLLPEDGRWDEPVEEIVFNLSGISTGLTRIQIKARTTVGLSSPFFTKRLYNLGLNYSFFTVNITDVGVELSWNMIGDTFGATFALYRIDDSSGRPDTLLIAENILPSGPREDQYLPFTVADPGAKPGRSYDYFVLGSYTIGTEQYEVSSGLIPATAMLSIAPGNLLSPVAPNPFNPSREPTAFSVDVPMTYRETVPEDAPSKGNSGPSGASAFLEPIRTPVDVVIYDVAGRRVKTIDSTHIYSQAVTYQWDGTNDNSDPAPAGIYFLRVVAGSKEQVRKIVLTR